MSRIHSRRIVPSSKRFVFARLLSLPTWLLFMAAKAYLEARGITRPLFVGGWALAQLWMFWVAPLIGGVLGGIIYRWLNEEPAKSA